MSGNMKILKVLLCLSVSVKINPLLQLYKRLNVKVDVQNSVGQSAFNIFLLEGTAAGSDLRSQNNKDKFGEMMVAKMLIDIFKCVDSIVELVLLPHLSHC